MQNTFAGLNEGMATVVAKTLADGFTPANLFINLLSEKNNVREYFNSQANIENLILDFQEMHTTQRENRAYEKKLEKTLKSIKNNTQDRYITETVFLTLILEEPKLNKVFNNVVSKYLNPIHVKEDLQGMVPPNPNLTWAKSEETILDFLGKDLTALAVSGELHEIVDRDDEMMRIIQILTRQTKSNPALVGEAGVGKTAVVEKLAHVLLDKASIPSTLHNYKLYELSISAIIATGEIEDAIAEIIKICAQEKIILFMDEVHLIMEQNGKIANLLKPAMARGDIKLIGATTEDEFKAFEKDKAMTRRFQPVKINQPEPTSTYRILKAKAREAEELHNVLIPNETLLKAMQLSERYIQHRQQPDKAIDLLEEASSKLRMILESKPEPLIDLDNKISDLDIQIEMIHVQNGKDDDLNDRNRKKVKEMSEEKTEKETERAELWAEYQKQRVLLNELIELKANLFSAEEEHKEALHYGDFVKAATFAITTIPDLKMKVQESENKILEFAKTTDENLIQNVVTPIMISKIIEDQTGIPVTSQDEDDIEKYRNIEATLMKEVHGQVKPIALISAAIKRSKAGLSDPNKPLGSFLNLGPTGVGKTYLAQKIAEFMFDTDKVMHRFDMSEYMEAHSVARLFGSPPGYVGHDEGGQLTEAIKRNPYSIILFDEIEKAHPRVFDALLQILDAGRMTDGQGNVVDFRNTIIMMTSNIGAHIIKLGLEKGHPVEAIEIALFDEVKKHFKPEFLNRFDAKVMFNSLLPEAVKGIAESELHKLADRLLEDNDLELIWHPDLAAFITNEAYDLTDGARPIKRYINDVIINDLTDSILDGTIKSGGMVYIVPDESGENAICAIPVTKDELAEIRKEEVQEVAIQGDLIKKTSSVVSEDDIVDAIVEDDPDRPKKKKKKKKKNQKDLMNETFTFKTETGD